MQFARFNEIENHARVEANTRKEPPKLSNMIQRIHIIDHLIQKYKTTTSILTSIFSSIFLPLSNGIGMS